MMIRIGMVDLDHSHPVYFLPILHRSTDLRVTAVWDGGAVQPAGFARTFAQEYGVAQVCGSLAELVASVDVGMLLGQDWDLHLERARPFLEAGKPVFVDKPIAGRRRDLDALQELATRMGTPMMGGSSMRYADPVSTLRAERTELGRVYSAYACGPGDFFNYGNHVVEMVAGFFGAGVEAVSYLGGGSCDLFQMEQRDGPPVVLQFSAGVNYTNNPCFLAVSTERGVRVAEPRGGWEISEALMREFARFVRTGQAPVPLVDSLEVVKVVLAAAEARRLGRRVRLDDVPLDAGFDGHAFTAMYAQGGGYKGTGLVEARSKYVVP
jgi:predicted dehydrogenase